MKPFFLLLCIALTGLGGCKSSKEPAKVNDIKWVLKTLNGKDVVLSDPKGEIFMLFDDVEKRVNGSAACNRFFGDYEMTDTKLTFSPMGATRMACPNDSDWEREFFQMLETVEGYTMKDNVFSFISKGNTVATFEGIKASAETHE